MHFETTLKPIVMKRNIFTILLLAAAGLAVAGCGDKKDYCEYLIETGAGVPDSCLDCQWRAPDTATISTTDYNTVTAFRDYFICHRETTLEHNNHRYRLAGWIYWGDPEGSEGPYYMHQDTTMVAIYLTDSENHVGKWVVVIPTQEWAMKYRENREEYLAKKWYITAILRVRDFSALHNYHLTPKDRCCSAYPLLEATSMDTINPLAR